MISSTQASEFEEINLSANHLTPNLHQKILNLLNDLAKKVEPQLRARDWGFEIENGLNVLDISLDLGSHEMVPSMETLAKFHELLLSETFLNTLSNETEIRVGTPGAECPMRVPQDFEPFISYAIKIQNWQDEVFECKLLEVSTDFIVVAKNLGVKTPEALKLPSIKIYFVDIKKANALVFHVESKKHKHKTSMKQRDFRPKALRTDG
jgi:ribosome maturation factor RimP